MYKVFSPLEPFIILLRPMHVLETNPTIDDFMTDLLQSLFNIEQLLSIYTQTEHKCELQTTANECLHSPSSND